MSSRTGGNPKNMSMFVNGKWLAHDDDGQLRQVHHILKIECGKDFEQCARMNTIFHYGPMPVSESHTDFWKKRKFEMLLVPAKNGVVWVRGEVMEWVEYNMGPGDRFMKWNLIAKLMASSNAGVGSLVRHPSKKEIRDDILINRTHKWDDKDVAIIVDIEDINSDMICTLKDANGPLSTKWKLADLRAFDGTMEFHVRCMNVQGGGILSHSHGNKSHLNINEAFSMKWLDRVTEEVGVEDDFHSGCWYFDPTQQDFDPAEMVKVEEVQQLRRDHIQFIDGNEAKMLNEREVWTNIYSMLDKRISDEIIDKELTCVEPFQEGLLSVPYLVYKHVVHHYLTIYTKEQDSSVDLTEESWCHVFYSLVKVGIFLRQDSEGHNCNHKLGAWFIKHICEKDEISISVVMDYMLYEVIMELGEWFMDNEEYRAAIWCFKLNLANVNGWDMSLHEENDRNSYCIGPMGCVALANKKLNNFVEAFEYFERAITTYGDMIIPLKLLVRQAKDLQEASKDWFGTSGYITSWDSSAPDDTEAIHCSSCGASRPAKKCSACRLVGFCNVDCQKEHWSKVHKYTCLGKLRGK